MTTPTTDPFVRCAAPEAGLCRACALLACSCFPPLGPTVDEKRAVDLLVGGLPGRTYADLRATVEALGDAATEGGDGMADAVTLTLAELGREELERDRARRQRA